MEKLAETDILANLRSEFCISKGPGLYEHQRYCDLYLQCNEQGVGVTMECSRMYFLLGSGLKFFELFSFFQRVWFLMRRKKNVIIKVIQVMNPKVHFVSNHEVFYDRNPKQNKHRYYSKVQMQQDDSRKTLISHSSSPNISFSLELVLIV